MCSSKSLGLSIAWTNAGKIMPAHSGTGNANITQKKTVSHSSKQNSNGKAVAIFTIAQFVPVFPDKLK